MISGYPSPISFSPPAPSIYAGPKITPAVFNPYFPSSSPQTAFPALAPFSKQTTLKGSIQNYPVISLLLTLIGGLGIGYLSHHYSLLTKLASAFKINAASASKPTPASKPAPPSKPTSPIITDNIKSIEEMDHLFKVRYPNRGLYDTTITQNYRNMPEIEHLTPNLRNLAVDEAKYKDLKEHGIQYFDELYHTPPIDILRRHPALNNLEASE